MKDIDHIIHSDQSHQVIVIIHDRHTEQVVPGNNTCHLFLVGIGSDFDNISVHHISQTYSRFCYHKFAQRDNTNQAVFVIDDIEIIDHLQVGGMLAQVDQ